MTGADDPGRAHEDEEPEELSDRLKPWVGISLAAIALLGTGLAILQTDASVKEGNTARETTRTAVSSLGANVIEGSVERLEADLSGESDALGFRRVFLDGGDLLFAAGAEPVSAEERADALARARDELPEARTQEALTQLRLETAELTLRQAALAETRVTWNDRSTQYTTVIAVLAVALFLVGFALVVGGPLRPAFFFLGLGVTAVVVGWAVWIYSLDVPETADQAIVATARGEVLTQEGGYAGAASAFTMAIEADGDYAPAYAGRAVAEVLAANPDLAATGAVTDVGGEATFAAIPDAQRALELSDDRDVTTLGLLALIGFYAAEYDLSVQATDAALAINDQIPDVWLIRSASELGLGDVDGAETSLARGSALLTDAQPTTRTRQLASDYITYMEWLVANEPNVADQAMALEQRIVRNETAFTLGREVSGEPPARGGVSINGLRFEDGRLRVTVTWTDLPPDTPLTGIGFERPIDGGAWTQPAELALFRDVTGSGRQVVSAPLDRTCLPTMVRVDLYVNGVRVDSATGPGVAATCP